ncbi:hypothetical protein GpartN1_g3760.t1 [Galdieria partita]|uniref:RWP-RK domain-containing protein n=1 Tax=Galdieria partita TaxID=83374 RepID=A0A9C7PWS2_9RHOD|nr:hypothetical protein GpartN1_g3760.t1 [Galdieria partita]
MERKNPGIAESERLHQVLEPSPFSNSQEDRLAQKEWQDLRAVSGALNSWTNVSHAPDNLVAMSLQYQANPFPSQQPLWRSTEGQLDPGNFVNEQFTSSFQHSKALTGHGTFSSVQETLVGQNMNGLQGMPYVSPSRWTQPYWNMSGVPNIPPNRSVQAQTQSALQEPPMKASIPCFATNSPAFYNSSPGLKTSAMSPNIGNRKEASVMSNRNENTIDNDSGSDMAGHMSDSIVYQSEGDFSSDQNSVTSRDENMPETHHPSRRRERIDWNTLKNHFHLPMNEASAKLGVCVTVLKKICRRFGISRWPHRKLKSVARHIERQERAFSVAPGVENLSYDEVLDLCRKRPHKRSRLDSDLESTKSEGDMPDILLHFGEAKEKENIRTWKSSHSGIDIIAESSVLIPASTSSINDMFQEFDAKFSPMVDSSYKKEFYLIFETMNRIFDSFEPQMPLKVLECICNALKMGMWTCDYYGNRITERVGIENIPSFDLPFSVSTQVMDTPFLRAFESCYDSKATVKRCFRVLESAESGGLYIVGKYHFHDEQSSQGSDKPVVLWAMMVVSGNTRE